MYKSSKVSASQKQQMINSLSCLEGHLSSVSEGDFYTDIYAAQIDVEAIKKLILKL